MNILRARFNKLKLNTKFTVFMVILVAIPLLIFVVTVFQYTKNNMLQQARDDLEDKITEDYAAAKKMAELCGMTSQIFIADTELRELLVRLEKDSPISTQEFLNFSQKQLSMLEGMVNSNPYIYQVRVYAENNSFPEMLPILYRKMRMENAPWAESYVSGEWQFNYQDFLLSERKEERLMALVTDIEDAYGEKIGVLEVAVSMKDMFPSIYRADENIWGCFVLQDGSVCAAEGGEVTVWSKEQREICEAVGNPEKSKMIHTEINKEEVLLAVCPMKELSGTYILLASVQEQAKEILRQELMVVMALLLLFLCMTILINGVVKSLLNKFYEILGVVRRIQNGDLKERIPEIGTDEMGELGSQINQMLDQMEILSKENVDREVLVKNTEIKALQNQINAHFIYNVLESIKMMAEIDEKYEISDAVTSLGELLRYNMKWVSGNVTIREEIAYIMNYVQLMNLRYDFTTLLSVKISEEIYEQQIPKMSLQPIVENAICHGIVELSEDATIYIKAVVHERDFEIEITDSGIGMTKEQMEWLERKLRGEVEANGGSGNGIGLKNVQDRIQMQFGKQYGLRFFSKEGCFTKVSVLLPLQDKVRGE
ncbi:MAG: histidine kinase [Eubacteriales bacterium]|nr:histidine kinase [Eubacteriales bacterium]